MSDDFELSTGLPASEMEAYLQLFLDETSEHLDTLVDALLLLEQEPDNVKQLNEAFRLIHSIKGSAAMMGLESITILTHRLENHFERLRSGLQSLHPEMMAVILKCIDFLRHCNDQLRQGQALRSAPELLDELERLSSATMADVAPRSPAATPATSSPHTPVAWRPMTEPGLPRFPEIGDSTTEKPSDLAVGAGSGDRPSEPLRQVLVTVWFEQDCPLPDVKSDLIRCRLSELGHVVASQPYPGQDLRPEESPELRLWVDTGCAVEQLRSAAEVDGVASVEIETSVGQGSDDGWIGRTPLPAPAGVETTIPAGTRARAAPNEDSTDSPASDRASVIDDTKSASGDSRAIVAETLRVDVERLDHLMNLAGELVVNQARFVQIARQMRPAFKKDNLATRARSLSELWRQTVGQESTSVTEMVESDHGWKSSELGELAGEIEGLVHQAQQWEASRRQFTQMVEAIDQLARVSKSLQRAVLDTRMVPIAPLFNRFRRVVRDISAELGKQVSLEIRGEKTELDKRMIDQLSDPMVHLVRNAIDHGIESQEVRRRQGKSAAGIVRLEAAHSGNHVLISVSDDGGGISVDRIRQRIVQRGLVSPAAAEQLSEEQVIEYIWHAGFSTAATVSDISGRGVGMDIVKTRIAALNGTVAIEQVAGQGTRFTIRLPLTLAIIRSLLFRLRDGIFAVPLENVREIVRLPRGQIVSVLSKRTFDVRGTFIPLVAIEDIFEWQDAREGLNPQADPKVPGTGQPKVNVVILQAGNRNLGLQVEELMGTQDIVIKSLAENFVQTRGLAGASILGDGSVCLLLDVAAIVDLAARNRGAAGVRGQDWGTDEMGVNRAVGK